MQNVPQEWVVDLKSVGGGEGALICLSRYLYHGVISEKNLLGDCQEIITFLDYPARSAHWQTRP